MHELGIAQSIVEIACEHAQGAKVRRVSLEIGELSAVMPDAIRFCFDVCCQGTSLEGATLEIAEVPGIAHCQQCGAEFAVDRLFAVCACGSSNLRLMQGQELKLKELETEELCV